MANRKEGVEERILLCAKEEFLSQGYRDASLRVIASKAETSTNAIYVRFGDKQGLYEAIIEPCVREFLERYITIQETFHQASGEKQLETREEYTENAVDTLLDYVYDHPEEFRLLTDTSYGKRFESFAHELAEMETEYTLKYSETVGWKLRNDTQMNEELLHLLMHGYLDACFEPVRHGMDREEAHRFIRMLRKYHSAGILSMFTGTELSE